MLYDFLLVDDRGYNGNYIQYNILKKYNPNQKFYNHIKKYNEYIPLNYPTHLDQTTVHFYHKHDMPDRNKEFSTVIEIMGDHDCRINTLYNWIFKRRIGNQKTDNRVEFRGKITDEFEKFFVSEFGTKFMNKHSIMYKDYILKYKSDYSRSSFISFVNEYVDDHNQNHYKDYDFNYENVKYRYKYEIDFHDIFYKGKSGLPLIDQFSDKLVEHQRKNDVLVDEIKRLFEIDL